MQLEKLEGEKTGSVAEGIGVAIGGEGVQRAKIEEIATQKGIPMDAIAIKMSPFEAISPMPEEVVNSVEDAKNLLKERVLDTRKNAHIIVVGVGNTCGVPNTRADVKRAVGSIKKRAKKLKEEEEREKRGWFLPRKKKEKANESFLSYYMHFLKRW